VPLSGEKLWSSRKSQLTGRSHRALFDDSLQEIYKDLYDKAKDLQQYWREHWAKYIQT